MAEPTNETPDIRQLREANERKDARIAELEAQVNDLSLFRRNAVIDATGLKPDEGWGKSLVRDIESGTYEGDYTATAVAEYMQKEYGVTVPALAKASEGGGEGTGSPPTPEQVLEQQRVEGGQRLDAVAAAAGVTPDGSDPSAAANEAEAKGDWQSALRIKVHEQMGAVLGQ